METKELIKRCKNGEAKAQNLLYEQFARAMFGLCLRYTAQEAEAEEVLMNGFLKVFRHIDRFENRNEGSFAAWIKKIMVNEALNFIRNQKKHIYQEIDEINAGIDEDENALEALQAEDIFEMIRVLPTGYRTVFNLYVVDGFTHSEIAEKLAISPNTSKTQLRKARLLLQANLKKNEIAL